MSPFENASGNSSWRNFPISAGVKIPLIFKGLGSHGHSRGYANLRERLGNIRLNQHKINTAKFTVRSHFLSRVRMVFAMMNSRRGADYRQRVLMVPASGDRESAPMRTQPQISPSPHRVTQTQTPPFGGRCLTWGIETLAGLEYAHKRCELQALGHRPLFFRGQTCIGTIRSGIMTGR
jgi:hypothetical protein